jgi:hypothetical protein
MRFTVNVERLQFLLKCFPHSLFNRVPIRH